MRHLAADGWHIRRVASTASREHGIDVEADRDGEQLLVEVKGYPSVTYSRGERAGEAKKTAQPPQARAYFSNALLSGVLMRSDNPDARVALVFPAMETYATLARRSAGPLGEPPSRCGSPTRPVPCTQFSRTVKRGDSLHLVR